MPWWVLAVLFIGFYGRVLRSNILDTINEDYVRTARAKGLRRDRVLVKHVLRNSLIPIVTLFGLDFAAVVGGSAILTETVFDLHGRRAVRGRLDPEPRPAADHGRARSTAPSSSSSSACSSTCSTRGSTRGSGPPRWPSA